MNIAKRFYSASTSMAPAYVHGSRPNAGEWLDYFGKKTSMSLRIDTGLHPWASFPGVPKSPDLFMNDAGVFFVWSVNSKRKGAMSTGESRASDMAI